MEAKVDSWVAYADQVREREKEAPLVINLYLKNLTSDTAGQILWECKGS